MRCPHCPITLRHRGALLSHLKSHQPKKCRHCGILVFKTKKYSTFQNHEKSCFQRIQRELKEQQQGPKEIKKYYCKGCCETFDYNCLFQRHTCIECVHCSQRFKHMTAVKNHKCPSLKHLDSGLEFRNLKDLVVKYVRSDS